MLANVDKETSSRFDSMISLRRELDLRGDETADALFSIIIPLSDRPETCIAQNEKSFENKLPHLQFSNSKLIIIKQTPIILVIYRKFTLPKCPTVLK